MMRVTKKIAIALVSLLPHAAGATIICVLPMRKYWLRHVIYLVQSHKLTNSRSKNQNQDLTPESMVEPLVFTIFHLSQSITPCDRYDPYFIGEKNCSSERSSNLPQFTQLVHREAR